MKRIKLSHSKEYFIDAIHIFVLFSFAVAQPLFDLLSRKTTFFVAHRSEPADVIILVFILCVLLPALVIFIEVVAGLLGQRTRKGVHGFIVASLVAIIALPALDKIFQGSGIMVFTGGVILGMAFTVTYLRFNAVRLFMTVLFPAILIFPGLFLFNSPVSKIVFPGTPRSTAAIKVGNPATIIMVIFDEFPVSSLMDEHNQIDPIRYPNFATLASESYWFRSARTVHGSTHIAIPAILTGSYPNPDKPRLPTAADYPNNIFTLLDGSYRIKALEASTAIYDKKPNKLEKRLAERMNLMLLDLSIVYLHILLPSDLTDRLPIVTQTWKHFRIKVKREDTYVKQMTLNKGKSQYRDRARLFSDFLKSISVSKKPTFYFAHFVLPHVPWEYLPSGDLYYETTIPGLDFKKEQWDDDDWLVVQGYQRHLLQIGFVDKLVGDLIDRLKTIGLYDKSLIVITADHGCNFWPNKPRRATIKEHPMGILGIPLFIKVPNQHRGIVSDRKVKSIDILPTISDILHIKLPWEIDGSSALNPPLKEKDSYVMYDTLKRKLSLFGSGTKPGGLFKIGPHKELIGQPINSIDVTEGNATVEIDQAIYYTNNELNLSCKISQITGCIFLQRNVGIRLNLAIGINGTIRAVTKTLPIENGMARWSAMLSKSSFKNGKNKVEVFIVSDNSTKLRLSHVRRQSSVTYSLFPPTGGRNEIITSSDGKTISVIKSALNGYWSIAHSENNYVVFYGWAADVKNFQLPETIVIFVNGKFLHTGSCNEYREDVAKAFNNEKLNNSGFKYYFPSSLFKDIINSEVRIFAVSKNGVAAELNPPVYSGFEYFVSRLYQKCLDREPDLPGMENWITGIENSTLSGGDVVKGFILSDEFISRNITNEGFATILYWAFFDREPDIDGYNSLLDDLNSGTRRQDILNKFLYSEEFKNLCHRYGITPHFRETHRAAH